ncbi:MAG: hypothetical protein ACXV8P_06305 [Methylobacter sp.]
MTDFFETIVQEKKKATLPDLSETELSFVLARPIKLNLIKHSDLLECLLYQIACNPRNLIAHTQRIFFCYRENLPAQLTAALVDLMIVLGERGASLKQRMLIGAKNKLDVEQWLLLQDISQSGKPPPVVPFALLATGIVGVTQLVKQSAAAQSNGPDALSLARDYINYCQLDEAKTVLELAILKNIDTDELQHELLMLYRSTRDVGSYWRMVGLLTEFDNPHQYLWDELRSSFPEQAYED